MLSTTRLTAVLPKVASAVVPVGVSRASTHTSPTLRYLMRCSGGVARRSLSLLAAQARQARQGRRRQIRARRTYATNAYPPHSPQNPPTSQYQKVDYLNAHTSIESAFARVEREGHLAAAQPTRGRVNTIINICPQQEVWIVERLGKFYESVGGGIHFYIPLIDRIAYSFSMKEQALIIPSRSAITKDNVRIHCIGVLYYKIVDPKSAAYGCGDPVFALSQLAQTSLRSVIGTLSLDETFHERSLVNLRVVDTCNEAAKVWGIVCLRHEIREIQPPDNVLHAMEMQMEAERKKRVDILQSEGEQQSVINRAEAHKRELILKSEAEKLHSINVAEGKAASLRIQTEAERDAQILAAEGAALALERIAVAYGAQGGPDAVKFELATQYINAMKELAKKNNTMIVPSNVADVSSVVATATNIIQNLGTPKL